MEEYIFTFGSNHPYEGKCTRVQGDYEEARKKMIGKFGTHWAFQYSADEWEEVKKRLTEQGFEDFIEKEVPFDELEFYNG